MPEMLTVKEVATILKVSYDTALAFVKYSGIDCQVVGRQYRISADKLKAFLNRKGTIITDLTGGR